MRVAAVFNHAHIATLFQQPGCSVNILQHALECSQGLFFRVAKYCLCLFLAAVDAMVLNMNSNIPPHFNRIGIVVSVLDYTNPYLKSTI